ncbi:hypothetical protein M405DRAFT_808506 [Rhizopogon salebrosus TDB-379]|nr:hypothetical protein M405DRAFT_808506 [Rhizopogon salebrosus TDB-379]
MVSLRTAVQFLWIDAAHHHPNELLLGSLFDDDVATPCPLCLIASSNIEMYMMGMGKENVESGASQAEKKRTFP